MRVKRGLVVASLILSLLATGGLTFAAFSAGAGEDATSNERVDGSPVPNPTSLADREARSGVRAQDEGGSPADLLYMGGAAASGLVLLASLVLFRVEVRTEKAARKMREDRSEYHRDMRQYNRLLKGPPQNNT